jgi:antitoxin YefM
MAHAGTVQTLRNSKVEDRLNELLDSAAQPDERVTITESGSPAAILIGVDEWEALQDTLFWLSHKDGPGTIAKARAELADGKGLTEEQIRAEFGVPKHTV